MCGIFGILNKHKDGFFARDWDMLKAMATMTIIRGEQSSGFCSVSLKDNKKSTITKTLGTPYEIFHDPQLGPKWRDIFLTNSDVFFGHGRLATKGKILVKNAHPFREGGVTLVHNGTIDSGLAEHTTKDVEVDSHALTHAIAEKGFAEALKGVNGAYAIIAHNAKDGKIYIARNSQRPLHYALWGDKVLIMSEKEALQYILHKFAFSNCPIYEFLPSYLYTYDLNAAFTQRELIKGEDLYAKKTYPVSHYSGYSSAWDDDDNWQQSANGVMTPKLSKITAPFTEKYAPGEEVTFIVETVEEAHGNKNTTKKQYKYTACDDSNDDAKIIFYTNENLPELRAAVGTARVHSIVYGDKRKPLFLVKYKNIVWEPDVLPDRVIQEPNGELETSGGTSPATPFPLQTVPHSPGTGTKSGTVEAKKALTEIKPLGGHILPYSKWKSICRTHNCRTCEKPVKLFDYEKTLVLQHGNKLRMYCSNCLAHADTNQLAALLSTQQKKEHLTMDTLVSNILQ